MSLIFLKDTEQTTEVSLAVSRVPLFHVKAGRWSEWKRSFVSIVLKREFYAWQWSLFPATVKGFKQSEEAFQSLLPTAGREATLLRDPWGKCTWVNTGASEQLVLSPISAHLEQQWSPEIFFPAKELEHQIGGLLGFPLWEEPGDLPNCLK